MEEPLVSVVIPSKETASTIARCLDSIIKQSYKNIEIIVVDNYSKDNTIDIAKRYTSNIFTLGPERSPQANYGVEKASGKYIYEVAPDFVLEDVNLIRDAVSVAEKNNYAAILIHNASDPTLSFWARVRKFERDMFAMDDLSVAVRFIRRDVFLSVGGFDPELVAGEDYDLHNRIIEKYNIGRISAREIHIREYKSISEVALKHYYYGKTIYRFLKKNNSRGIKQVLPVKKIYMKHYKEFLVHPTLTLGFIIYQTVKYVAAALGMLASVLQH